MARWLDRVDDLLYEGESVVTEVKYGEDDDGGGPFGIGGGPGENGVVVTTHRVLAFTPDASGANFESVDRPNVERASTGPKGNSNYLLQAIKAVLVGFMMVIGGAMIQLDGIASGIDFDSSTTRLGLGGMLQMMEQVLGLLALVDDVLRAAGALSLLAGVLLMGLYLLTRKRVLAIEVAGDDVEDLELPAPEDERVVEQIEQALYGAGESVADEDRDSGGDAGADRHPMA